MQGPPDKKCTGKVTEHVDDGVIWKALELIREYQFYPRDAIHAATALIAGAERIYSEDRDYDTIRGLKRE